MQLYCTINKINGKLYIGKDCGRYPYYLGSGKILKYAIKKFGKQLDISKVCKGKRQSSGGFGWAYQEVYHSLQ